MGPNAERQTRSVARQKQTVTDGWLRRIDLIILPLVFVVDVLVFSTMLRTDSVTAADRVAILSYSAVGVGLLIFRRLAPELVFCATWVHCMLAQLLTDAYMPILILLVALAAVAELRPIRVSLVALIAVLVPVGFLVFGAEQAASVQARLPATVGSALFYLAITVLAWAIGRRVGRYQARLRGLREQHTLEVEEQRAAAENAISAERLRIARELHDIVAHSVTIMVLHAAGAKRVVDTDPTRAKASLTTIEDSGQQAMGELRRLLELLRENDAGSVRSGSPIPGLLQLDQVLNTVRDSGVAVALEITGEPGRLDTSIDLAAFRLVQEALTNVTKHRGEGARATVSIEWGAEKMTVAVEDDGRGASDLVPMSTGNGLAGLRERIAIAGGDFVAGPTEVGGFRVAARLPLSVLPPGTPAPAAPLEPPAQGMDGTAEATDRAEGDESPELPTFVRADP